MTCQHGENLGLDLPYSANWGSMNHGGHYPQNGGGMKPSIVFFLFHQDVVLRG